MTPKKSKTRLIPKSLMQTGIDLCKQNIIQFLDDARLIIGQGRLSHAYVPIELAIEELGKIVILKEASVSTTDPIEVNESVFTGVGAHDFKSKKA